jgi:hypothetical protein
VDSQARHNRQVRRKRHDQDDPMSMQQELLTRLAASVPASYHASGPAATEPTALAGLAQCGLGDLHAACRAGDWLASLQNRDGSCGVTAAQRAPCWPTSLAILLWQALDQQSSDDRYRDSLDRAVAWTLAERGRTNVRRPHVGHDTTLVGWSWAADTHSWLEPTAMFVLALKAVGHSKHARTREAVRLLVDRLLPGGGANYGNTIVLGQPLLPHVQPTGLAMMALAGEGYKDRRVELSLEYLERELLRTTATASLCYGILGLAAHDRKPRESEAWLQRAYERFAGQSGSPYQLALISLATATNHPINSLGGRNTKLTQRREDAKF